MFNKKIHAWYSPFPEESDKQFILMASIVTGDSRRTMYAVSPEEMNEDDDILIPEPHVFFADQEEDLELMCWQIEAGRELGNNWYVVDETNLWTDLLGEDHQLLTNDCHN